ncbi:MAG: ankyrin repeat domain-containing protein [Bacteroidota bacterium]
MKSIRFLLLACLTLASAAPLSAQDLSDQLFQAIKDNDKSKALELLNQGADVNAISATGTTVLYECALMQDENSAAELIEALGNRKVDANARVGDFTALTGYFASMKPSLAVTTALLNIGCDPNTPVLNSLATPLHYLMSFGDSDEMVEIYNQLMRAGANPGAKDENGNTPLHLAVQAGKEKFVNELLADRDKFDINATNKSGKSALDIAREMNMTSLVATLDWAGNQAPKAAAAPTKEELNAQLFKLLEEDNLKELVTMQNNPAATKSIFPEFMDLINKGADRNAVNAKGRPLTEVALYCMSEDDAVKMLGYMGENGAETSYLNKLLHGYVLEMMHWGQKGGPSLKVVNEFFRLKCSNEYALTQGTTLLHGYIYYHGRQQRAPEIVETLLANGVNPGIKDKRGETALYIAALQASPKCMEKLLLHLDKSDIQAKDSKGKTALAIAREKMELWKGDANKKKAYQEVIDMLVAAGATE